MEGGRAFAAPKLREIKGIYGGELAGHYYFRDFFYSDSGIMAALIILDVVAEMKKEGISFLSLSEELKNTTTQGRLTLELKRKKRRWTR